MWRLTYDAKKMVAGTLELLSMALEADCDSTGADAARGLALRLDHGSQYLSDHFVRQIACWGIAPSFAFVEQPQTNNVAC